MLLIIFDAVFFTLRHSIISIFRAINKYVLLGTSELIIALIALTLFFLILYLGYSYIVSFVIILLASLSSLIFSIIVSFLYFKKKDYK